MPQLPNFHIEDQTQQQDVNWALDCLPTCLASAINQQTGKQLTGAQVKSATLGAGYKGFTAATEFVQFADAQGCTLFPINANSGMALVMEAHAQLAKGYPVIATEPDPYEPSPTDGWSHIICFYGWDTNSLTAMDPWHGKSITKSDAEWAALLEFHQIWIVQKKGGPMIPHGWSDDGTTLKSPNGVPVIKGFRDYVLSRSWDPDNWAVAPEAGRASLELANPSLGSGTWQPFRLTVLEWTSQRGVFEMWVGPELVALRLQEAQNGGCLSQDDKTVISDVIAATKLVSETSTHILAQLNTLK